MPWIWPSSSSLPCLRSWFCSLMAVGGGLKSTAPQAPLAVVGTGYVPARWLAQASSSEAGALGAQAASAPSAAPAGAAGTCRASVPVRAAEVPHVDSSENGEQATAQQISASPRRTRRRRGDQVHSGTALCHKGELRTAQVAVNSIESGIAVFLVEVFGEVWAAAWSACWVSSASIGSGLGRLGSARARVVGGRRHQ